MWVQWLWFSWQSGRFRYMRSGVRIESSVKFNNKHIYCSSLTVKRQNLRKRGRCRERKMLGEQATRKMKERKWQSERVWVYFLAGNARRDDCISGWRNITKWRPDYFVSNYFQLLFYCLIDKSFLAWNEAFKKSLSMLECRLGTLSVYQKRQNVDKRTYFVFRAI